MLHLQSELLSEQGERGGGKGGRGERKRFADRPTSLSFISKKSRLKGRKGGKEGGSVPSLFHQYLNREERAWEEKGKGRKKNKGIFSGFFAFTHLFSGRRLNVGGEERGRCGHRY